MSSLFHKKDKKSESSKDITTLDGRESTFKTSPTKWPSSLPSMDTMADAGFYFTPTDRYSDCCTCFRCGIKMFNWLPDDTPRVEHKKFSSSCKEAKTWKEISDSELEKSNPNRAEQTESQNKIRSKIADKAKRLTGGFHRRNSEADRSQPLPYLSKESQSSDKTSEVGREMNDEEKLASIRRQREIAEKALDGLEKLSSFYQTGTNEQKLAEQSIVAQTAELERLRSEEEKLCASMGTLSFGNGWSTSKNHQEPLSPTLNGDESPLTRGRAGSRARALPKLPSQMMKEGPRVPTSIAKMNPTTSNDTMNDWKNKSSMNVESNQKPIEEWIEYFTDDGTPYYYSTATQQTVWEIPSSTHSSMFPVSSK